MLKILLSILFLIAGCVEGNPPAMATVSSNITKVIYTGDNISTSFNFGTGGYSVPVYLATDIQVYTQNVSTGTITTLTLNTNYTVALTQVSYSLSNTVVYYTAVINLAGGSSPYGALPVGTNLIINRSVPYTNLINITDYSATPAATYNQGYDRATMLAQQLYTLTQQGVLQPVSATTPITVPTPNNGYILCWSGTTLSNCANNGTGTPIAIPIPNSDLSTLTQAGLVNGSSLTGSATLSSLTTTSHATGTLTTTGNVGIGSANPGTILDVQGTIRALGGSFALNSLNSSGVNWTTINNYGISASAFTQTANLKISYGIAQSVTSSGVTITNLPFTSASTYYIEATVDAGSYVQVDVSVAKTSGSQAVIYTNNNVNVDWVSVGY